MIKYFYSAIVGALTYAFIPKDFKRLLTPVLNRLRGLYFLIVTVAIVVVLL